MCLYDMGNFYLSYPVWLTKISIIYLYAPKVTGSMSPLLLICDWVISEYCLFLLNQDWNNVGCVGIKQEIHKNEKEIKAKIQFTLKI